MRTINLTKENNARLKKRNQMGVKVYKGGQHYCHPKSSTRCKSCNENTNTVPCINQKPQNAVSHSIPGHKNTTIQVSLKTFKIINHINSLSDAIY